MAGAQAGADRHRRRVFVGLLILGLVLVTFTSTMPSTLPALFPTIIRYGALAIAFNVSVSLFGGTTPLATEALVVWPRRTPASAGPRTSPRST